MSYYALHHVEPLSLTLFSMTLSSVMRVDLEFLKSLFELVKKLMQSRKKNNLLGTFADSSKCTLMPKIQFELCLSEISFDCKPLKIKVCVVAKLKKKAFLDVLLLKDESKLKM